jgi:hypothetical protein
MEQTPQNIPTPESEEILTFEEFSHRDEDEWPYYNNFFKYFDDDYLADDIYRIHDYYKKFESEHSSLATLLRDETKKRKESYKSTMKFHNSLKDIENNLYKAYKIMRSYGVSDQELFA